MDKFSSAVQTSDVYKQHDVSSPCIYLLLCCLWYPRHGYHGNTC